MTWLFALFALLCGALRCFRGAVVRPAEASGAVVDATHARTPHGVPAGVMRPNGLVARTDTLCGHVGPAFGRRRDIACGCDASDRVRWKRRPQSRLSIAPRFIARAFGAPPNRVQSRR